MKAVISLLSVLLISACSTSLSVPDVDEAPQIMQRSSTYTDLLSLPAPKGRILVSVYDFRDQTGQYKSSPASSFSTAVPQGGTALLTTALLESNWFIPLEREGLQNLLTERKIIRAAQGKGETVNNHNNGLPSLNSANIMIEGGVVAYDWNIKTGGAGAKYLGISAAGEYRADQVTVNLRAVDVRSGRILSSVTISKTIYSHQLSMGAFRYIDYQELLEAELGYSNNEPVNIALMSAIDASIIHLIVDGVARGLWQPRDFDDLTKNKIYQKYSSQVREIL
ncbi:CsgG/HfaB family protein [Vibrio maerlii]|uniref:CsgG/HfaB family protein n=1 Tax=Vibrio maerlii TaxID=2231648 RepID=UPI000E3BF5EF|nr:CsgG/HfaB family protein [Vibrio maerlii]